MRPGLTISCVGHVGVLAWGLVAFAARPHEAPPAEALPVEFVSATEFSQLTAGVKNAPKVVDEPKPLAEKVGDAKPVKELAPKVADKPEVTTDAAAPPQPEQPKPKAESKPPEKAAKPKAPEFKPDQIAEELKKEESKKPPKPVEKQQEFKPDQIAEELRKQESKKPAKPEDKPAPPNEAHRAAKFDANQVAALLDKREPQRQVASAETLNGVASIGTPNGHAARLSQSEIDALRAKLISLWNPPAAVSSNPDQYVVTIRIKLSRDHQLVGQPEVLTGGQGALFEATRDSAVRAVVKAQPYDMLSQTTYDLWKEMDINFDPREVFGG